MTRAVLCNLGFEYELAGRQPPRIVDERAARWNHILRLVPGFEDAEPLRADREYEAVLPWGASDAARRVVGRASRAWPPVDAVRAANDKRTSHEIERDLGIALPGATIAATIDEVLETVSGSGVTHVVKHPFGVSGRLAAVVTPAPDAPMRARLAKLHADGRSLVVEPYVDIAHEFSLHFDASPQGVDFVGACGLFVDEHGVYRGNVAPLDGVPDAIVATAAEAASRVASLGYLGPIGVDGFVGTLGGESIVRPVSEINARWTFGRLALHLAARRGVALRWLHPPETSKPLRGAERLPVDVDPDGRSGTYWYRVARAAFEPAILGAARGMNGDGERL